jgi:hypothetical protein
VECAAQNLEDERCSCIIAEELGFDKWKIVKYCKYAVLIRGWRASSEVHFGDKEQKFDDKEQKVGGKIRFNGEEHEVEVEIKDDQLFIHFSEGANTSNWYHAVYIDHKRS